MIRFLRKYQPRSGLLAVLYWMLVSLAALALIFTLFYFLDSYLPGSGMF
jgi:hypothetical protein